jgi:copper chaperone
MRLQIENMTCGGCARSVTKAVQSVDPKAVVNADPPQRLVDIQTSAQTAVVTAALEKAGFTAVPAS